MGSLFKEVILQMVMGQEAFLYMAGLLMMKVLRENIHVQAYYRWRTVAEIRTPVNSLSL